MKEIKHDRVGNGLNAGQNNFLCIAGRMKKKYLDCLLTALPACVLLVELSSFALAGTSPHTGRNYEEPGDDHGRVAVLRTALETNGFIVNKGSAALARPLLAVDEKVIDSASGNNAGQNYKLLLIPPFPSAEVEDQNRLEDIFTLSPTEAVVYIGPTPPRGDYFSFTPFLWASRTEPLIPKGDWVFAAVGDPLNNALIKTEGNGNPFHKQTIIIFTADRGVSERIAALAMAAGYPESMINAYILPSSLLHLGTDSNDVDSLIILLRTANLTSAAQERNYLGDDFYANIFRVTPNPAPALDPFPTPPLRNRKWMSERDLYPDLENGLNRLKAAIIARTPSVQFESFDTIRWFAESRDVLEENERSSLLYHKFVAGECSDTTYLRTAQDGVSANFILGTEHMVIVYGVNHAATGLATYSSFGVYGDWVTAVFCRDNPLEYEYGCDDRIWNGVAGMTSHDFAGSAEEYIPGDPMAPFLYAVKVLRRPPSARHEKYWVVVPGLDPASQCPSPSYCIDLVKPITIGYRAYLNPATASGPDYGDIIQDRALWFKLR